MNHDMRDCLSVVKLFACIKGTEGHRISYQWVTGVRLALEVLHRLETYGQQSEEILKRPAILNQQESRQGRRKDKERERGGRKGGRRSNLLKGEKFLKQRQYK